MDIKKEHLYKMRLYRHLTHSPHGELNTKSISQYLPILQRN